MENTSCLTAHNHTTYILGQGVEALKTTMYAYASSQRPFAGTLFAMVL